MKCFLNRNKLVIFLLIFFLFPNFVFAQVGTCSSVGYSIYTINGIYTDIRGAQNNQIALLNKLKITTFNNEPITVDFFHNESHIAGLGDSIDVMVEKILESMAMSNYDLVEMINDASQKIKTQKILLVAHSEGNFYANNFYKEVAGIGKVPAQSIGIYGVATPAGYIAGFGSKYITSSTDKVIKKVRLGNILNVLPTNADIKLPNENLNGHGFSDTYLEYEGDRIIREIKWSLNQLSSTKIQDENKPCILPPELTLIHKIQGGALAVIDHPIETTNKVLDATYNTALAIGNGVIKVTTVLASSISSLAQSLFNNTKSLAVNNSASVINATNDTNSAMAESVSQNTTPEPTQKNSQPNTEAVGAEVTPPPKTIAVSVPAVSVIPIVVFHGGGKGSASISQTESQAEVETSPEPEPKQEPVPPKEEEIIELVVDTTPPVISIIGESSIEITKDTVYTDAGATALDNVDGDITVNIVPVNLVNVHTIADYTITYDGKDAAGNFATQVTRLVHVIAPPPTPDTTAPVITVLGNNPETILLGSTYTDAGATAIDDKDGTRSVATVGTVNTKFPNVYTITYTATDIAGNSATATRVVNVSDVISDLAVLSSDLNNNGIPDSEEADVVMDNSYITLPAGEYHFNNLKITNNAQLYPAGDSSSTNTFKGVKIVANNITIDAGSYIRADGLGYSKSSGPGAPAAEANSGASYGGIGGVGFDGSSPVATYGSATRPIDLGSGGNGETQSRGGGAIRLVISGTLQNNGIISAQGVSGSSGGSIYVTTNNLAGTGTFNADGGGWYCPTHCHEPGGGGRIAIYYQNSSFIGTATAYGVTGSWAPVKAKDGTVGFFDISNNTLRVEKYWRFETADSPFSFSHIILTNISQTTTGDNINISSDDLLLDQSSTFTLSNNPILNIPTINIDHTAMLTLSGSETLNVNTLNIDNNSELNIIPEHILTLTIPNIILTNDGRIRADEAGYSRDAGPGAPISGTRAGASYGGLGAVGSDGSTPALTYGSDTAPVDFGSGGNGEAQSRGGGAIRLIVSGTLQNDGRISAEGNDSGSGGSIYVTANNLTGIGAFDARGGGGYCPTFCYAPGGGGRIAIYSPNNSFTGTVTAFGHFEITGASGIGTVVNLPLQ